MSNCLPPLPIAGATTINQPFPTAKTVETVQDATFRLADGTIYTKYDNSAFTADDSDGGVLLNVARYAAVFGKALNK